MTTGLRHAFKEWAVICRALAEGRQALILRKGGVAEVGGAFRVEHARFWLFPTYVHQQRDGIMTKTVPLLEQAEAARPPDNVVSLSHFAEVTQVYQILDLQKVLNLAGFHCWSEETVRARFAYRSPGLFVLPVRVYRAAEVVALATTAYYAGCKSWVELEQELPTGGAMPVLADAAFGEIQRSLQRLLT
jgi:hypothetical protein